MMMLFSDFLRRVKLEIRVDLEKTYSCGSVIPWEFSCFNGNVLVGRKINSSFLSDQSGRVRFVLVTPCLVGRYRRSNLKKIDLRTTCLY